MVFPEPGPYRFRVRMKGQELDGPVLYLVEREEAPEGPSLQLDRKRVDAQRTGQREARRRPGSTGPETPLDP